MYSYYSILINFIKIKVGGIGIFLTMTPGAIPEKTLISGLEPVAKPKQIKRF
jgi:hypothetical protein